MGRIKRYAQLGLTVLLSAFLLVGCSTEPLAETPATSQFSNLPRLNGTAIVQLAVNDSNITVKVEGEKAPVTAGNFVDLVQRGVYDGVSFHRVVREPEPFVVQGGDPQSKAIDGPDPRLGTGNFVDPSTGAPRYIPLEITPEGDEQPLYGKTFPSAGIEGSPELSHARGAIAMARSQAPNSASSQFYFALADLSFLDGQYAVFGYVTEGMDVVDGIQQGDRIQSATVISGIENLELPN
ncbi:MAG: peptidylprolyl isomerase [Cyanothece sp. SIO2G6]|nr:peptidylprolyl isomerase [Cyanothece sp. SIO2G6]